MSGVIFTMPPHTGAIAQAVEWACSSAPGWAERARIALGLTEALTNAVVHGTLGIASGARDVDLGLYLDDIEDASLRARRGERVRITVERDASVFTIALAWSNHACPERLRRRPDEPDPLATHGRGLTIIYSSFDRVLWSDDGKSMAMLLLRGADAVSQT